MLAVHAIPKTTLNLQFRGGYQPGSRGRKIKKGDNWNIQCINCKQSFMNRVTLRKHYHTECKGFDTVVIGQTFDKTKDKENSKTSTKEEKVMSENAMERDKNVVNENVIENVNRKVMNPKVENLPEICRKEVVIDKTENLHCHEKGAKLGEITARLSGNLLNQQTETLSEINSKGHKRKLETVVDDSTFASYFEKLPKSRKFEETYKTLYRSLTEDILQEKRHSLFDRIPNNERAFKCDKCNISFKYHCKFEIHMKHIHSETVESKDMGKAAEKPEMKPENNITVRPKPNAHMKGNDQHFGVLPETGSTLVSETKRDRTLEAIKLSQEAVDECNILVMKKLGVSKEDTRKKQPTGPEERLVEEEQKAKTRAMENEDDVSDKTGTDLQGERNSTSPENVRAAIAYRNRMLLEMHRQWYQTMAKSFEQANRQNLGVPNSVVGTSPVDHAIRRPFKCPMCKVCFKYNEKLEIHLRNAHGNNLESKDSANTKSQDNVINVDEVPESKNMFVDRKVEEDQKALTQTIPYKSAIEVKTELNICNDNTRASPDIANKEGWIKDEATLDQNENHVSTDTESDAHYIEMEPSPEKIGTEQENQEKDRKLMLANMLTELKSENGSKIKQLDRISTERRPFKCTKCKAHFKHQKRFEMHQQYAHGNKTENTIVVGNNDTIKENYFVNVAKPDIAGIAMENNETKAKHICAICHVSFRYVSRLRRHMKNVHQIQESEQNYQCHVCDTKYYNKHQLMIHQVNAHGMKQMAEEIHSVMAETPKVVINGQTHIVKQPDQKCNTPTRFAQTINADDVMKHLKANLTSFSQPKTPVVQPKHLNMSRDEFECRTDPKILIKPKVEKRASPPINNTRNDFDMPLDLSMKTGNSSFSGSGSSLATGSGKCHTPGNTEPRAIDLTKTTSIPLASIQQEMNILRSYYNSSSSPYV